MGRRASREHVLRPDRQRVKASGGRVAVQVAEIVLPGEWLEKDPSWSPETATNIKDWLNALLDELDGCAIALTLFEGCQGRIDPSPEQLAEERRRMETVADGLRANGVELPLHEMLDRVRFDLRRADWKAGIMPEYYTRALPVMHAESFVSHVDMILKLVKTLADEVASHSGVLKPIAAKLEAAIGGAKDVRDSIQHRDERAVKQEHGRPIERKFINQSGFYGKVFVRRCLVWNRLVYTANDGNIAEVEVSSATLAAGRAAVQGSHYAFTWSGRKRYHPW
jgi:hypothetical protein